MIDPDMLNQMPKDLIENLKNENFKMKDEYFKKYFTNVYSNEPINPNFYIKKCKYQLDPTSETSCNIKIMKNYVCKLISPVSSKKNVDIYMIVEKRASDFKTSFGSSCFLALGEINDKRITNLTDKIEYISRVFSIHIQANDGFVFGFYQLNTAVTRCLYIKVLCELDFKLYDIDKPDELFPSDEIIGPVFDNYNHLNPIQALPLQQEVSIDKTILSFKNLISCDISKNKEESTKALIKQKIQKRCFNHYSNQGSQIDINCFVFNDDMIVNNNDYSLYNVIEKKTGKKVFAVVKKNPLKQQFSNELKIRSSLEFPSILSIVGYSEIDFYNNNNNPMFFVEHCSGGSLFDLMH